MTPMANFAIMIKHALHRRLFKLDLSSFEIHHDVVEFLDLTEAGNVKVRIYPKRERDRYAHTLDADGFFVRPETLRPFEYPAVEGAQGDNE